MTPASDKNQFEFWLMEMDAVIDRFRSELPLSLREGLDGSDASLSLLEQHVLDKFPGARALLEASCTGFLDGAARYVGEIFRRRTGSRWSLDLSDPKKLYFGVPALTGGTLRMALCPLTTITTLADRRTGRFLTELLETTSQRGSA